jgi:hypothetical protein
MSNYVQCNDCINKVSCGIAQPGFGCFGGEREKFLIDQKPDAELVYVKNGRYHPVTHGTFARITRLVLENPTIYGYPAMALTPEEVFGC